MKHVRDMEPIRSWNLLSIYDGGWPIQSNQSLHDALKQPLSAAFRVWDKIDITAIFADSDNRAKFKATISKENDIYHIDGVVHIHHSLVKDHNDGEVRFYSYINVWWDKAE